MEQKKGLNITIASLLVALAGFLGYGGNKLLGGEALDEKAYTTMMGASTNLISVPNSLVFADSTTTDTALVAEAGSITQHLDTGGIRKVILNIQAVGGTATSTMFIRQMGSYDGTTYYDIATSTDALSNAATSSVAMTPKAVQFDPGTATTSIAVPFVIDGYADTRFVMYGENLSTDPDDGVQAWITAVFVRDVQ